ncbi:15771_t:CDS:2, partial [Gigaspora margarita]
RAKAEFRSGNTDLAVILGGLTSMCQPLDVCINKPFKDQLHKIWHKWMADGGNGITKKGNLKHASLNTVYHWVLDAWNEISEDIIIRVFKKCGISNCLLESEDHLIFATDDESDEDEIEDFDDDEEFDENEEFNEIKESDKDDECDGDELDGDKSDGDESNGD